MTEEEIRDALDKSERDNRVLRNAFATLKAAVANTLYVSKKVLQTTMLIVSLKWFGIWAALGLFGAILLTELIEMGYQKVLEIKPE
jgi:hypothetical protein